MTTLLLIPAYQGLSSSIRALVDDATRCGWVSLTGEGCSCITMARNQLLDLAVSRFARRPPPAPRYVWWIDSDMVVSIPTLLELQEELEHVRDHIQAPTLLSARYVSRMRVGAPAWQVLHPDTPALPEGQLLCDHVGLGCAVALWDDMVSAWRAAPALADGQPMARAPFASMSAAGQWYSEDRWFCRHWRQEIGGRVVLSTKAVGHLIQVPAYPEVVTP